MGKLVATLAAVAILLAFILGAVLARQGADHAWRDQQLDQITVEAAWRWEQFRLCGGAALLALSVAVLAGTGLVGLRWLDKHASTIKPTPAGYPLIVKRLGPLGGLFIFDPNRAPFPATVAVNQGRTVQVLQIAAPSPGPEQVQVTTQAQAVQFVHAAVQNGHRVEVPASFAQLPPPRSGLELPPCLDGTVGAVDPLLIAAIEHNWQEGE